MDRDQNDHCTMTFMGRNYRFVRMRGLSRVECVGLDDPELSIVLDLSRVDWKLYHVMAQGMMARRDAETVE